MRQRDRRAEPTRARTRVVREGGEVNVPMAENASVRRERSQGLSLFAVVKSEWVSQQKEGSASPKVNSGEQRYETGGGRGGHKPRLVSSQTDLA